MSIFAALEFCLIVFAPLPFAATLALRAFRAPAGGSVSHSLQVAASYWLIHQTAAALLLGMTASLNNAMVVGLSALSLVVGFWVLFADPAFRADRKEFLRRFVLSAEENRLFLSAFVGLFLFLTYLLATTLVTDYDSLYYHLPYVAEWTQKHRFTIHAQLLQDPIGYYPCNWEAVCALFYWPFHEDLMVLFPNAAAWLGLVPGIYGVARYFGAKKPMAFSAALLVLTSPIVVSNVTTLHVDIAFAAFFLFALYFFLRSLESQSLIDFAFFLLNGACMLGVKTSGVLHLVLLFAMTAFLAVHARRAWLSMLLHGKTARLAVCLLPALLLLSSYWYVRNLVVMGNPLGVLRVKIGGLVLFDGVGSFQNLVAATSLGALFSFGDASDTMTVFIAFLRECGYGLMALAAISLPFALFSRVSFVKRITLLGLLAGAFLLYLFTPYTGDNGAHPGRITPWIGQAIRYGFPFVSLLAIALAVGASRSRILSLLVPGLSALAGALALYFAVGLALCLTALACAGACAAIVFASLRWRGSCGSK